MATASVAIDRVFQNRELIRGQARRALAWGCAAALLLAALMLHLMFLLSVFADRGRFSERVAVADLPRLYRLTGDPQVDPARDDLPIEALSGLVPVRMEDQGVLSAVWRQSGSVRRAILDSTYRALPALRSNFSALLLLTVSAAICCLLYIFCLVQAYQASSVAGADLTDRLRGSVFRQAVRLGAEDLSGGVQTHATELLVDRLDVVERGVSRWVREVAVALPEIVVLVHCAAIVDLRTTVQWLLPLGLCAWLIRESLQHQEEVRRANSQSLRTLWQQLAQRFHFPRLVRGFGLEDLQQEEFDGIIRGQRAAQLQSERADWNGALRHWALIAAVVIIGGFLLLLLGVKTALETPRQFSVAGAVVFVASFVLLLKPLTALAGLRTVATDVARASADVSNFLNEVPHVGQAVGARFLNPLARTIHFEQVHFSAPGGGPSLHAIDLKLPAGKSYSVATMEPLEGRAFLSLLCRLVEPQHGRILFDGEDIAWATLESLRAEAVLISAADQPLPGTIYDNILAGRREASRPQVLDASKLAHAHNFVAGLPDGYDTRIGAGGSELSVGQLFRLNLARAALRNPALLLIEEPDEALDEDTKALIEDSYQRMFPGRTVFIIPARMATIRLADQILVLKGGRMSAIGSRDALVQDSPLYRHWEYLRFNEFRRNDE